MRIFSWPHETFVPSVRRRVNRRQASPTHPSAISVVCLPSVRLFRQFDVVALQEVKRNLRALRDLMKWLGQNWAFLMNDVNLGAADNSERTAFLFDERRVKTSGLACELVVPQEWLDEVGEGALL